MPDDSSFSPARRTLRRVASIVKKCDCADQRRCKHSWIVRYRTGGRGSPQREKAFKPAQYDNARRAAMDFAKSVEGDKATGSLRDTARADRTRFWEYAEMVLAARTGLSARSVGRYRNSLEHVRESLGPMSLTDVAHRETLQAAVNAYTGSPAPLVSALSMVLTRAVRDGLIPSNPTRFVETPKRSRHEVEVPTDARIRAVRDALPAYMRLFVYLTAGVGLRPSEALAAHTACVRGGMYRVSEQVLSGSALGPLKHRSPGEFRDIPLAAYVADAIDEQKRAEGIEEGYLFVGRKRSTYVTHIVVEEAFRRVGAGFTPHALRHRFASVALAAGEPITDVAAWLGHRNVNETFSTYRHFIPDRASAARTALQAARWDAHTDATTADATEPDEG